MNLKSGAVQQFEHFSHFQSLTEFHHHMEMWLVNYKQDFSKGELTRTPKARSFYGRNPWSKPCEN